MNNIKSLVHVYKKLRYILSNSQKKKSILVFTSMIMVSLLELLGVSSIYPLTQMMISADEMRGKWYMAWIFWVNPNIENNQAIFVMGVIIIVIFIVKNAASVFFAYVQHKFAAEFKRETSVLMLEAYMKRPYEFFIKTNSSNVIQWVSSDPNSVYNVLLNLFQLLGECVTTILIGLYLIRIDWIIAIFSLSIALACFLILTLGFKNRSKKAGIISREANVETYQACCQAVTGIKEITVLDRQDIFIEQYDKYMEKMAKATVTYNVINACPERILEGVCIGGFLGVVCIRILTGIEISSFVPTLGSFAMGAFKILPSISKISSRLTQIVYYLPGLQNCYDNLKEVKGIENEHMVECENSTKNGMQSDLIFTDSLSLENIHWKYQNTDEEVLSGLNLKINRGDLVALIGASGAGKTTLADVILGLLKPQIGSVKMDGIDIFSIRHEWSQVIGYVPQSVFLIDDTIRANVAFGLPKKNVSDEKIWLALEQAQLKKYVEKLPNGLDTIVGERGVKLSGGQRQRIAIARALYEDPDILVLDEATSSLDTDTEEAVVESIDALQGNKTLIIVAHRLTTIRNCDRIYEILDGKAIERDREKVLEGYI